jgi:hypothetical protein
MSKALLPHHHHHFLLFHHLFHLPQLDFSIKILNFIIKNLNKKKLFVNLPRYHQVISFEHWDLRLRQLVLFFLFFSVEVLVVQF